jgi:hypothetical protein
LQCTFAKGARFPIIANMGRRQTPRKPRKRAPAPAAPKPLRYQFTLTMNAPLLDAVDAIAAKTGRHRSETLDDMVRFYLEHHPDGRLVK